MTETVGWTWLLGVGAVVGLLSGMFGIGGASIATPLLALLGVEGLQAVASPLPVTIPIAASAGVAYVRSDEVQWRVAGLSLLGAVPFGVAGALLARVVGGRALLVAAGIAVAVVGARLVRPIGEETRAAGSHRRESGPLLVAATAIVGLLTGLLANGGGFLLVPLYLLAFGLRMRPAAGTSLAVIVGLSVPTVITHGIVGNIDWRVAGLLAVTAVPGAFVAAHLAQAMVQRKIRKAFGWLLVVFGIYFSARELMA
ncbi:MAG: sulfite exporter TauE/SafE family protein [Nitriliruptorales bacterium]